MGPRGNGIGAEVFSALAMGIAGGSVPRGALILRIGTRGAAARALGAQVVGQTVVLFGAEGTRGARGHGADCRADG